MASSALTPDTNAALDFLNWFSPSGPWSLTAIGTDRKNIDTAVFFPSDADSCRAWIESRNGRQNLYFQINPPMHGVVKRPTKEQIARVEWLHVDIDPNPVGSMDSERTRILDSLTTGRPPNIPEPSCIIDSGNGFWGMWRLDLPVLMSGASSIVDIERYNRKLEQVFGADSCHNVDRLCRLPGSVNIPTGQKLKRGRTLALARMQFTSETTYRLTEFAQAAVGAVDVTMAPTGRVVIDPQGRRIANIDDLDEWGVDERVKIICVQGSHPEEGPKARDNSRSAWLFDAVCSLVRAQVPDDVIYSILINPNFRISESVLEKGAKARNYAIRQIESAQDEVVRPELRELNERHAVIQNVGGACRVATFTRDGQGRPSVSFQSFQDIRNGYMNRRVVDGEKPKRLGDFWLENERRRSYREIVFDPTEAAPPDMLNLWTGFGVEPKAGAWDRMKDHIRQVIASGNADHAIYILNWLAWSVQNPASPAEVALVLIGGKGTGKGTLVGAMMRIFGNHALQISNPDLLVGRFNAHLRDVCLLFADEAYWPGNKRFEGVLKALITEPTIPIEAKGIDAVPALNRLHIIMASNESWVVPAGEEERRYAVFELSRDRQQDHAYFAELRTEMDHGGVEAMLFDLLAWDLKGWHPRSHIPRTTALARQFEETLPPLDKFIFDMLMSGELPAFALPMPDGHFFLATSVLTDAVNRKYRTTISATKVGDLLGPGRGPNSRSLRFPNAREGGNRGFIFPSLPVSRQAWEQARFRPEWELVAEWSRAQSEHKESPF